MHEVTEVPERGGELGAKGGFRDTRHCYGERSGKRMARIVLVVEV